MTHTYSHPKWQFNPYLTPMHYCVIHNRINRQNLIWTFVSEINRRSTWPWLEERSKRLCLKLPFGLSDPAHHLLLSVALTATEVYGVILGSIPHPAGWWELSPWLQPLSSHPIWPGLQTLQPSKNNGYFWTPGREDGTVHFERMTQKTWHDMAFLLCF